MPKPIEPFEKILKLKQPLHIFLGRSADSVEGGFRAAWVPPLLSVARKLYMEGERSRVLIQTLYFLGSFQDATALQLQSL